MIILTIRQSADYSLHKDIKIIIINDEEQMQILTLEMLKPENV